MKTAASPLLQFVLDEHLRGVLLRAILRHNQTSGLPIDVVQVGDPADLPLGSKDDFLLQWAEGANRIIVSRDKSTLPDTMTAHLRSGGHSPGVMIVPESYRLSEIVEWLVLAAYTSTPEEWADQVRYLPSAKSN